MTGVSPVRRAAVAPSDDQLRLMAKVARMYHERGMRQAEIAAELHISQPRVSRLLKRAVEVGVVRTVVALPPGVHTDLEDALERRFGLAEAVVVDAEGADDDVVRPLGAAAATYLETTLIGDERVGVSSWSASLLAVVEAMRPSRSRVADEVVQLVGGIGEPRVQVQATRLLGRLAEVTGGVPVSLPAPGLLGSPAGRAPLMADPTVAAVAARWPALTTAIVGIGSLEPSPLLRESGNAMAESDQEALRAAGAVGDVCLRFFDADGVHVASPLDDRVVGISPEVLRAIPRRIGVAGGRRKHTAILAALRGGWITVLVTDAAEARRLLA